MIRHQLATSRHPSRRDADRAPYSASLLQAAAALYGADAVAGLRQPAEDERKARRDGPA